MGARRALLAVWIATAGVAVACSSFDGSDPTTNADGGIDSAANDVAAPTESPPEPTSASDASRAPIARACRAGDPFGTPSRVMFAGEVSTRTFAVPRLTDDEQNLYFTEGLPTPPNGSFRILKAHRTFPNTVFDDPVIADELVSDDLKRCDGYVGPVHPWVSSTGDSVYYSRACTASTTTTKPFYDVWAVLKQADGGWSMPGKVNVDLDASQFCPFMADDSRTTIYYARMPNPITAPLTADLYFAKRNTPNEPFEAPVKVGDAFADPTRIEFLPVLSADGLELFFQRTLDVGTARQIWSAKRSTTSDAFGDPTAIDTGLPNDTTQSPGWLSPDGCRLYYGEVLHYMGSDQSPSVLWMRSRLPSDAGPTQTDAD